MTWRPSETHLRDARVARLMRRLGVEGIDALRARSVSEPEWFWSAVADDLGIAFDPPPRAIVDAVEGPAWARWFDGGGINVSAVCLDRWADTPGADDRVALVGEDESGRVRTYTFASLRDEVSALTAGLRGWGLRPGETCAVMMPLVPEAAIALLAIARAGAIAVPIFSGFAASAVAARLEDAGCRLVLTADGSLRRGHPTRVAPTVRAARTATAVETVAVLPLLGEPIGEGEITWNDLLALGRGGDGAPAKTEAESPFLLAYTSGTTGRPKGAVHVHGGFSVQVACEAAYALDLGPGDRLCWITDLGWIMGSWTIVGTLANGATVVLLDGAPDVPDAGRPWSLVERHRLTHIGVSPTLVRSLMRAGEGPVRAHDRSTLRIIAVTGEPLNPSAARWLSEVVGDGRLPTMNISGGTEIGVVILAPYPVEPIAEASVGGPCLGMDADVVDPDGRPVRGSVGELVIRGSWPGMTRGIWRDPERYLATYWSTFSGVWRHGDWARIDETGWSVLGRADETLNIAGKRIGASEIESVLVAHPGVREAAAVGVHDDLKGEVPWCFSVLVEGAGLDEAALGEIVVAALGRPFRPGRAVIVEDLPRTRSGKLLRRSLAALVDGRDPGDLATIEDPAVLDAIRERLGSA